MVRPHLKSIIGVLAVAGWLAACTSSTTTGQPGIAAKSAPPSAESSSGSAAPSAPSSAAASGLPSGWIDQDVTFTAGGMTIYATYRHRVESTRGPAAMLIAGSGPADRNGDETGYPEGSLRLLADQLAADGVATLRYDKLGSGKTGPGRYAADPGAIRVAPYLEEAAAGLRWLAAQPRSDPNGLSVYGHSEGGLYALLLATASSGSVPPIARLGLIEPASRRFLDIIRDQLNAQLDAAQESGKLSAAAAHTASDQIEQAIIAVRAGRAPGTFPQIAQPFFNPVAVGYVRDIDRDDPAGVAARLRPGTAALLTCSSNDPQITCADTDHLAAGLRSAHVALDYVRLTGMDHGLKADTSHDGANNTAPLPMDPALVTALARFVRS